MKRCNLSNAFSLNISHRVMMPGLAAATLTGLMVMMARPANAQTWAANVGMEAEVVLGHAVFNR